MHLLLLLPISIPPLGWPIKVELNPKVRRPGPLPAQGALYQFAQVTSSRTSPEGLTGIHVIGFSNSNIQRLTLEGRLDELRDGSSGVRSNMKVNGASVNLEAGVDGKSSKSVETRLEPARENRWGVWVTGFGDFVSVDADANAAGYNFTTGGVSLGVDYRLTDSLAIERWANTRIPGPLSTPAAISTLIVAGAGCMPAG